MLQGKNNTFTRKNYLQTLMLVLMLVMQGCIQNTGLGGKRLGVKTSASGDSAGNGAGGGGQGSGKSDGTITAIDDETFANGIAELRHLVDPFDGTYKTKISIPKNFNGNLYLSGLNITSLNDRLIYVRFKFGRELAVIEVPATIGRAPGITPQTDIEVLMLDMSDRPFENLRLLYDLYDYSSGTDPETDVYSKNLYCRGLHLEHDSTFEESNDSEFACDDAGERCLYTYAKVKDSGLYSGGIAKIPATPQLDTTKNGQPYSSEAHSVVLNRCLPDIYSTMATPAEQAVAKSDLETTLQSLLIGGGIGFGSIINFDTSGDGSSDVSYVYNGPYRALNQSEWEITGAAAIDPLYGVFGGYLSGSTGFNGGYNARLFPRAGKLSLASNVEYIGTSDEDDAYAARTLLSLATSGESNWTNGCNIRVQNYDSYSGEGIGSCNVTAEIELLALNTVTGEKEVLTDTTTNQLKLQLTRESVVDFSDREVLESAFKTCSSSNACGSDECCFNNRCWSKDLVAQCLEDVDVVGNRGVGETCSSDFECSSFCCNQSTGVCAVHSNTESDPVLCNKSPGQQCVAKEYCRKENISTCFVVKTGVSAQGAVTCALRCYNVPTFGSCSNGICIPPNTPDVPSFDPSNPDCSEAIDPPSS